MAYGSSNVGCPCLQINMEEVAKMRNKLPRSDLIGVTDISDQELDAIIASYKDAHPSDGGRIVIGYLRSRNIHLLRSRIRNNIHRIDPHVIELRKLTIHHRT